MNYNGLLCIGVLFNVIAQLLLKLASKELNVFQPKENLVNKLLSMSSNPFFWGALFFYGTGFVIYTIVLSKLELSKAYPIASVAAIVLIFISSILFFHETVNVFKVIGLILCLSGIAFIFI